ncbi:MAG: 2-amino-3,7-dideoxy-D-threo-hept-6-ulosonate synthase [Candidatus Bathyarchaeia archaeon]
MSTGKKRRLQRVFRPDGRSVIVAMDHGVTQGPIPGLVNMQLMVSKLEAGGADAVIVHKGIAQNIETGEIALIVHLSASTTVGPDPLWKVRVCNVVEAVKLGADAVSVHINFGAPQEPKMLVKLGSVVREASEYGLPVLAMMYPRGPNIKNEHDPEIVKHAARVGAEIGADIIKTNYTGSQETFVDVIKGTPVPLVIAGGPKAKTDSDVLGMIYDAAQVGAAGVSIGRNVFQHSDPTAMVKAVSAVLHEGAKVNDALRILGR